METSVTQPGEEVDAHQPFNRPPLFQQEQEQEIQMLRQKLKADQKAFDFHNNSTTKKLLDKFEESRILLASPKELQL